MHVPSSSHSIVSAKKNPGPTFSSPIPTTNLHTSPFFSRSPLHRTSTSRCNGPRLGRGPFYREDFDARSTQLPPRAVARIERSTRTTKDKRHEPPGRDLLQKQAGARPQETLNILVFFMHMYFSYCKLSILVHDCFHSTRLADRALAFALFLTSSVAFLFLV